MRTTETQQFRADMLLDHAKSSGMDLVGKLINTAKIGGWPGGPAMIIQTNPDPPEIVLQVRHQTVMDPEEPNKLW